MDRYTCQLDLQIMCVLLDEWFLKDGPERERRGRERERERDQKAGGFLNKGFGSSMVVGIHESDGNDRAL
jgi:hypothetical protein